MPLMSGNLIKNFFAGPATRPYPIATRQPFSRARSQVFFDHSKCVYCGICAEICPVNAIRMEEDRENLRINRAYDSFNCIYCARCVELCPNEVLKMGVDHLEPTDNKEEMYFKGR